MKKSKLFFILFIAFMVLFSILTLTVTVLVFTIAKTSFPILLIPATFAVASLLVSLVSLSFYRELQSKGL